MEGLPACTSIEPVALPPGPAYARGAAAQLTSARMTFISAQAVGKFAKCSARATLAMRAFLARELGGAEREGAFSAALRADGAVVAGSAVLAGGLLRGCSWAASDLDVWVPTSPAAGTPPFRCTAAFLDEMVGVGGGAASPSGGPAPLAGGKRTAESAGFGAAGAGGANLDTTNDYDGCFTGWDGPLPLESANTMVRSVVSRSVPRAPPLPAISVQLVESAFPHAAVRRGGVVNEPTPPLPTLHPPQQAVVAGFDLTRCMAAYDGASVYALAADLDADGELRDPCRTGLNRLRLTGSSYWHLLRTRRRLTKYARRGIACDTADEVWLAAEMAELVGNPHTLMRACAYGRLQEACALIRAGADATLVTSASLRIFNSGAPCFAGRVAQTTPGQGGVDDFRALLTDYVATHATPRFFAARAAARAATVSPGFAAAVRGLDHEASCLVARFVSGFAGGSLLEAEAAERAEAERAKARGPAATAAAAAERIAAIKRLLPRFKGRRRNVYWDGDDDDEEGEDEEEDRGEGAAD